jgi:competence protein ComEC
MTAFVLLYAGISQPSHSAIRSAILSMIVATALLNSRSVDRLQLLSLGAILMLLWHPLDLYSAGFHLSFAVVFAFVFLVPEIRHLFQSWRNPDEVALQGSRSDSLPKQIRTAVVNWGSRCIQFAVIAWLITLPLVVYNFGHASSWSILGSLLTLPIVLLSLLAGAIKILLTLLWPIAAGKWAILCGSPAHLLLYTVYVLGRLPGSSVALPAPSIGLIVVYYLLLFAPLLPYRWGMVGRRRWILRLAPLIGVASIFLLQFSTIASPMVSADLRVTLLSLGAGQCAVVEAPGGHPILIDAGSTTVTDVAQKIVEPFLQAEGEQQVDEIFLSHGDFDHISAAGEITSANNVRQVLTSFHFRKNAVGNVPDQILLEELEKLNRSPREIARGDHFDLGSGAAIDVLWPPKVADLNSNNAGLVLRLTYAGRSVLFPADIQDPGFTGVLQNANALKSDILIAAHHGSSENLTPPFLAAVHPQIILSSNFWRLTSKQKRFESMIGHTPLYRTPECGAITVTIHKDGTLSIDTFVKGVKPK